MLPVTNVYMTDYGPIEIPEEIFNQTLFITVTCESAAVEVYRDDFWPDDVPENKPFFEWREAATERLKQEIMAL